MEKHPYKDSVQIVAINSANKGDLEYAKGSYKNKGFYKFPVKGHYPKKRCDYIAFYLSNDDCCDEPDENKKGILYYAKIIKYQMMPRKDICSDKNFLMRNRKQNNKPFYKIELGSLKILPKKITNRKNHRVSYRYSSLNKLKRCNDISQL